MISAMWPFRLFTKTNGSKPHNLALLRRMSTDRARCILDQDARDAAVYLRIEKQCDQLREIRKALQNRVNVSDDDE